MSIAEAPVLPAFTGDEVTRDMPRRVRRVTRVAGLTDKDVAQRIRMGTSRYSERMTGRTRFTVAELVDIANSVGAPVGVFFDVAALAEWVRTGSRSTGAPDLPPARARAVAVWGVEGDVVLARPGQQVLPMKLPRQDRVNGRR